MMMINKPEVMPAICGMVGRTPKFTPEVASMMLFGPGVTEVTKAKENKAAMVAGE
jgi:hypothetical protein